MGPEVTPANRDLEDNNSNTDSTANTTTTTTKTKIGYVVVPYTKGLSESFRNICGKHGIQAYFKRNITIKQTLRRPKDQDHKWVNIQLQVPGHHIQCTGHNATADNFNIIGREDRDLGRTIKEAIYIRVNNPSLNQNVGKYHPSQLWDRVLFNTPGLKIDSTQHPLHVHNYGLTQTIPTNNISPFATGISGHALNSEHVLRDT